MNANLIERVLAAVALVPPGRVVSYGDVAELVGTGPRQVGTIMRDHSGGFPWWRVVGASGDLPGPLAQRAAEHWAREGTPVKPSGRGCRIAACRADLEAWAQACGS